MKPAMDQGGNLVNSSSKNGISELELLIKQRSFTRSEIDRLTELLRSRVVDSPTRDEVKWTETNLERHKGLTSNPVQENRNVHEIVSTPVVGSPAEVAKAYMGSRRPSKVSPSMFGVPTQTLRENSTLLPFSSKSPITSLVGSCINPPPTGFSFGGSSSSSVATTNATPTLFGLSQSASSGPLFSLTPTSSLSSISQSQFVFGNSSSIPSIPGFGQPPALPPPAGFLFGSWSPSPSLPFQLGGSFSSDSDGGGGGGGGGDKSARRILRVNKYRNRKR